MNLFRIATFTGWLNPSLNFWFPDDEMTHTKIVDFFGIALGSSLLVGLLPGAIIDYFGMSFKSSQPLLNLACQLLIQSLVNISQLSTQVSC